jgi:osmoprotectant transport system ATP-binding protein
VNNQPPGLVLTGVSKRFGATRVLDDVGLDVPGGRLTAVLGPSGCGKTTLLRLIAGFAHLDVARNVTFGLPRRARADSARVAELLELVGLEPGDAGRYPAQLSGGQRQRVGLARALAADPPVLLMDEPFGALDPITRARLQQELRRLHREVAKTVIFVTHDIDEAITMGDRIAILREGGKLAQYDTPDAILAHPADAFVDQFIGEDRALRRLALHRVGDVVLEPDTADDGLLRVSTASTVRNAVSLMLQSGADRVVAVDDDGATTGVLTLAHSTELLRL